MPWSFTAEIAVRLLRCEECEVPARLQRVPGQMRREDDLGSLEEGVGEIGGRFAFHNIQGERPQAAVVKRRANG